MRIYHYPVKPQDGWQEVEMPENSEILFVGYREGRSLRVWAKVPTV